MLTIPDLTEAVDAAEAILRDVYRIDVAKALNPLKRKDFITITDRLSRALQKASAGTEAKALRAALNKLDVDWPNLTARQKNRVFVAARRSLQPIPKRIMPRVKETLTVSGTKTVGGTRRAVKRQFKLDIGSTFTASDKRIVESVTKSQFNFITDEYGRRRVRFSNKARDIVSRGVKQGLGRREISEELRRKLTTATLNRSRHYWEVVAASFTNRARVWGELNTFQEAGVEKFVFEAVLDEATTEVCRLMHGKVFTVASGINHFERLDELSKPEDIKQESPWVRQTRDSKGNPILAIKRGDKLTRVATIKKPGAGAKDKIGTYSNVMSDRALSQNGITMPPLHGLCRSIILPEL